MTYLNSYASVMVDLNEYDVLKEAAHRMSMGSPLGTGAKWEREETA
jgi:hypothetical protein